MSSSMITSIYTVTQVSIKFRRKKKANKNMGISIVHNTNNAYENGDKCVPIWKRRGMREKWEETLNAPLDIVTKTNRLDITESPSFEFVFGLRTRKGTLKDVYSSNTNQGKPSTASLNPSLHQSKARADYTIFRPGSISFPCSPISWLNKHGRRCAL